MKCNSVPTNVASRLFLRSQVMPALKLENRRICQQRGVLGVADVPGLSAEGRVCKAGLLEPGGPAGTATSQA